MRITTFIIASITFTFSVTTAYAYVCGPSENTDVYSEKNSFAISEDQLKSLKKWTDGLRDHYRGDRVITMNTNVEIDEIDHQLLGRKRELAVRLALIDLDFTTPDMEVIEKISVGRTYGIGGATEDIKRVEINFTPGCPQLPRYLNKDGVTK